MSIYDTLNPEQKEAVLQTEGAGFNFSRSRFWKDPCADPSNCLSD